MLCGTTITPAFLYKTLAAVNPPTALALANHRRMTPGASTCLPPTLDGAIDRVPVCCWPLAAALCCQCSPEGATLPPSVCTSRTPTDTPCGSDATLADTIFISTACATSWPATFNPSTET